MKNERVSDKQSRREFMRNAALGTVVLGTAAVGVNSLGSRLFSSTSKAAAPAATQAQAANAFQVVAPAQGTVFGTTTPTILTADIAIAGYGATGISAAIEAYDAGVKDIIVIEKASWLGGEMRRSGGGLAGADTVVQKYLGVQDNFNDFYGYMLACGQGMVDPSLVRSFATNDNVDWIINTLGGEPLSKWAFSVDSTGKPQSPLPANTPDAQINTPLLLNLNAGLNYSQQPVFFQEFGFAPVMRAHWFLGNPADAAFTKAHAGCTPGTGQQANGGTGVFKTLNDAVTARNNTGVGSITVMPSTTLTGLVASPDGEVLGISALDVNGNPLYIEAKKGVILGTGGWAGSARMAKNYLNLPPWQFSATNPASVRTEAEEDGVGILVAQAIGADTVNMGAGGGTATKAASALTPFSLQIDKPETLGATVGAGGLKINTDSQVININGDPIPRLYAGGRAAEAPYYMLYPVCGTLVSSAMWQGRIAGKNVAALRPWT